MKQVIAILLLAAAVIVAQPPPIITPSSGFSVPSPGTCGGPPNIGSLYTQIGDPATAYSGPYICVQTGPVTGGGGYGWAPTRSAIQLQGRQLATTAPTNGQAIVWDSTASTWKPGTVSGSVISGATTNAIVTAASATTIETKANAPTIDSSGNVSMGGTLLSGSASGIAGAADFAAGTVAAVPANSFGIGVGATMTASVRLESPNAVPAAHSLMVIGAPSSNKAAWAYKVLPDCPTGGLGFTQSTDAFGCNAGGGAAISGTPAATQTAQWTDATHVKGVAQGVFNVRLMYGAVPDGSTNNATAIAAAFTASNAVTTGIPTVYFDCDTGTTTCQYNYAGAGTSAFNPTRATTIACAPGVYLNYTGSAHAVDLGASGRSTPLEFPMTIQGCTFTGGASSTHGIYVNAYITQTKILDNTFFDFGNRTGFNIKYAGNNWESLVQGNVWFDDDGVTRNIMDAHTSEVHSVRIIGNSVECYNAGAGCSTVNIGVGFWIADQSKVIGNVIQYHAPLLRIPSTAIATGDRPTIIGNHFEGNAGATTPAITFGDPGGTGNINIGCMEFSGNDMFYPADSITPIVGPETPASSGYYLSNCPFNNNSWTSPSSGTYYINTNGGANNLWGRNQADGTFLTQNTTSPRVFDSNKDNQFMTQSRQGNGGALTGLVSFQADKMSLTAGNFHTVSAVLDCLDSSGSGTAQVCDATPTYDINGSNLTPVAGDMILYKTTTTNTGALTINVNGMGATPVKKNQGANALASGDLKLGIYNVLTFDGTNWDTAF